MTTEDQRYERCRNCEHRIEVLIDTFGCKLSYLQEPKHIEICPIEKEKQND
jgi:hypothetical protein